MAKAGACSGIGLFHYKETIMANNVQYTVTGYGPNYNVAQDSLPQDAGGAVSTQDWSQLLNTGIANTGNILGGLGTLIASIQGTNTGGGVVQIPTTTPPPTNPGPEQTPMNWTWVIVGVVILVVLLLLFFGLKSASK